MSDQPSNPEDGGASAPSVLQQWARVMDDVQAIAKTDYNSGQKFNFRGIDAVMNAVGPALRTHGVVVVPRIKSVNYRDVQVGSNRTNMRECTLTVQYVVYGPNGDHFSGEAPGEALDVGDKATAKAMSVAYRSFLLQSLTIPTHEPDPDESSYERAPEPQPGTVLRTPGQVTIDSAIKAMDENTRLDFGVWWSEAGLPKLAELTDAQIILVLDHLGNPHAAGHGAVRPGLGS